MFMFSSRHLEIWDLGFDYYCHIVRKYEWSFVTLGVDEGFKIVDTACCGSDEFRGVYNCGRKFGALPFTHCENLEDHMFFDSFHPTQKVFKQLAEEFWSGDAEIVKPLNFKQLFQYEPTLGTYWDC